MAGKQRVRFLKGAKWAIVPSVAILLSACGASTASKPTSSSSSSSTAKVAMAHQPMTFWFDHITLSQAKIVQKLLQPWAAAHHTTVTVTPVDHTSTVVDTAIASGTLPNIMVMSQGYPDIYALDHLALNISKWDPSLAAYMTKNQDVHLAKGNTIYQGDVYGALEVVVPDITLVNTKVMNADHIPIPKTWSQLDTQTLPAMEKAHLNFAGPGSSQWDWYAVLYSYGGQVYSPSGNKVVMASSAGQAAIKAYITPYIKFRSIAPTSLAATPTMMDLFAQGKYPLQVTSVADLAALKQVPNFNPKDWEIEPYLGGPAGDYDWTGGTSVAAFKHTPAVNKEETSLLAYFWSAKVQRKMMEDFYSQTGTLDGSGNLAAWNGVNFPGLSTHTISVLKTEMANSVGVQSKTKVTKAQILGLGNTWQKIGDQFTKMVLPHATVSGAVPLLKTAAAELQAGIDAVQSGSGS